MVNSKNNRSVVGIFDAGSLCLSKISLICILYENMVYSDLQQSLVTEPIGSKIGIESKSLLVIN